MKKLWIVGIGPGDQIQMTPQACHALETSEVLCGYTVYLDLVRAQYPQKEFLSSGMMHETERCLMAIEAARAGRTTAVLCSGDAGVYGMASLILELLGESEDVSVEIVPGITAALSGAALLGAPLSHDFVVLSLSDLLTPWELIERRLRAAAMGDYCIVLYNPSSKKRAGYLKRACNILMEEQLSPSTVCGYVRNIGREGEQTAVCTLEELADTAVDMFTTVFIGNSTTKKIQNRLVTPRGYQNKR